MLQYENHCITRTFWPGTPFLDNWSCHGDPGINQSNLMLIIRHSLASLGNHWKQNKGSHARICPRASGGGPGGRRAARGPALLNHSPWVVIPCQALSVSVTLLSQGLCPKQKCIKLSIASPAWAQRSPERFHGSLMTPVPPTVVYSLKQDHRIQIIHSQYGHSILSSSRVGS